MPVVHISLDTFKTLLTLAGRPADDKALASLQRDADEGKTGLLPLDGLTLDIDVKLAGKQTPVHNVVGVVPGAGALASEVILIGGHYDHLGLGNVNPRTGARAIFSGADDNASGSSGVALLAERFGQRLARTRRDLETPVNRRTLIFAAFTGEERGLLGSQYMVQNLRDLGLDAGRITAMINMDMIGRLRNDRVSIGGTGTGDRWTPILDAALAGSGLKAARGESGLAPSDNTSFYRKGIPVLFFFTGLHADYHGPNDTADKINCEGAAKVLNVVDAVVQQLWADPVKLALAKPKNEGAGGLGGIGAPRGGAYLGIAPDPAMAGDGVVIGQVMDGGPASKAGLKEGDRITLLAGQKIASMADLARALGKCKPDESVSLTVDRDGKDQKIDVVLGKRGG
jgi:hypothetical protein